MAACDISYALNAVTASSTCTATVNGVTKTGVRPRINEWHHVSVYSATDCVAKMPNWMVF